MKLRYTKEDFQKAVMTSNSVSEILVKLGLQPKGGNYKVFYSNAKKFNIDVSAFINSTTYGVQAEKRNCITDEFFKKTIGNNTSIRAVLISLGLNDANGSNNRWAKTKITKLRIDTSHFLGQGHLRGKTHNWSNKIPLEEILIQDSEYASTNHLRKRLVKEGVLTYKCSICEIENWNDSPLTLHLDHINGDNTDNRIENLRLLCPNCHSQTETYCGKNK